MVKRIIKIAPITRVIKKTHWNPLNKRAQDILKLIRSRVNNPMIPPAPTEPEQASPTADDWQRFKKKFVQEYGSEQVQETGMTHSDFFEYFRSGNRECDDEYDVRVRQSITNERDKNKPSWQR
jgi:hypothetical protein